MDPKQLQFTQTHEWISSDGKVGISDHAQKEITDVVFVELPPVGKVIEAGGEIGTIESVKAAFPIYAPKSGKVIQVNTALNGDPSLINQSPYDKGWIYQLEVSGENSQLMDESAYKHFLETAAH